MSQLPLKEIQGIILRGYGELNSACFLLLAIGDAKLAKNWLKTLQLRNGEVKPRATEHCVNIAFTPSGLTKLGLSEEVLGMFAGEFNEGMAGTGHRCRILGDHGDSSPDRWRWGGPNNDAVDIMLMLYAGDDAALGALVERESGDLARRGLRLIERLDSVTLPGRKEHFGFRDGISQPAIEGYNSDSSPGNTIAAGEFVLGYLNAYGQYTDRPTVKPEQDPDSLLLPAPDDRSRHDLGMNGSYLVFRQLSQNVQAFWNYLAENAPGIIAGDKTQACIALASKMVGRWPSGAPLVNSPDADNPQLADDNDFMYVGSGDADGLKCPIGSHVRRSNPRDALDPKPGSERSIEVGKRHRIVRRGRAYGSPAADSMQPGDIVGKPDDGKDRGLHFICFNTQIGRQFEFIQHTWVNSTKFDGLYDDDDPLIGDRGGTESHPAGTFTVQQEPVRRRVTGMPRFVAVHGGGYFFMPGISAVRYLASLK
jgi:Dyp-type peroxidase family